MTTEGQTELRRIAEGAEVALNSGHYTCGPDCWSTDVVAHRVAWSPALAIAALDVIEAARVLRVTEQTEDYPMGLTEVRQAELDAALMRFDQLSQGEKR